MVIDLDKAATQALFASLVGIGQSRVSERITAGVLRDGAPLGEWLHQYCERLRDEASGRAGDDQGSLTRARTAEAEASARLKEMQIMEKAGKLVPIEEVEPLLLAMVTAARTELLALPEKLRLEIKALYGVDVDVSLIEARVCESLNHLASTVPGVVVDEEQPE